jgi:protein SCO1/2
MQKNKSLKKGVVLFLILLLPSILYLLLTTGKHNFGILPVIGPKNVVETTNDNGDVITDTTYHTIAPFALINQFGEAFTEQDLLGNVYVADFFFTICPTICPAMSANMKTLQDEFGKYNDFKLVSYTVWPEGDSAAALKEYGEKYQADFNTWSFITGDKSVIYDLAYTSYYCNAMADSTAPGGFLHSSYFVLVDKEGRIRSGIDSITKAVRAVYDGTSEASMKALREDLRTLMFEYKVEKKKNNKYKQ